MNEFVPDIEVDYPGIVDASNLGDDHTVEFRIGFLVETNQVVLMSVCLMDMASYNETNKRAFDLRYGIRLQYIDKPWKVTSMDFNQATKRRYIHPNNRETVLGLIQRATKILIAHVKPTIITMSSYDRNLPEAALVKYRAIERCLNEAGFGTHDTYRDAKGHDRWQFVAAT